MIIVISLFNGCEACVKMHCQLAKNAGVPENDIEKIASGSFPEDERLSKIVKTGSLLLKNRGKLFREEAQLIQTWGITETQLMEIVFLINMMAITNYFNNIGKSFKSL